MPPFTEIKCLGPGHMEVYRRSLEAHYSVLSRNGEERDV